MSSYIIREVFEAVYFNTALVDVPGILMNGYLLLHPRSRSLTCGSVLPARSCGNRQIPGNSSTSSLLIRRYSPALHQVLRRGLRSLRRREDDECTVQLFVDVMGDLVALVFEQFDCMALSFTFVKSLSG